MDGGIARRQHRSVRVDVELAALPVGDKPAGAFDDRHEGREVVEFQGILDHQVDMLELDRRLPTPGLLPKGREGEARAITMWVDRNIFGPAVGVVMSQIPIEGRFGETFKKDRSEFSGRNFDPERLRAALPVMRDQTYALLSLARAMRCAPSRRATRRR